MVMRGKLVRSGRLNFQFISMSWRMYLGKEILGSNFFYLFELLD